MSSTEPVVTKDAIQSALVTVIGGVGAVTAAFGWWNPTPAQTVAVGSAGAGVWSFLSLVASFRVRAKVTPVASVDAQVEAAQIAAVQSASLRMNPPNQGA